MSKPKIELSTDSLSKIVLKAARLKMKRDDQSLLRHLSDQEYEQLQNEIGDLPADLLADELILAGVQIIKLCHQLDEIKTVLKRK